jgi:hypothetical protein
VLVSIVVAVATVALISIAWANLLARQEARRDQRAGVIPVCRELPRNINTATAWRRR